MAFGGSLAMILACAPFCAEIMLAGYFGTYIYYEDGLKEFTSINAMFMILIQIGAHVFTDPIAAFMFKRLNGKLMVTLGYALLLLCMATMLFAKTSTTYILAMCGLVPMATSILQFTAFMSLWEWVSPNKRGLVTGAVNMFGVLAMALVLIFELTIINRNGLVADDTLYPKTIVEQFKKFILIFAAVQAVFGLFSIFVYQRNDASVIRENGYR